MARRKGDWVPCEGFGLTSTLPGLDTLNIVLVRTGDQADLGAGQPEAREVMTVEETAAVITYRVVGAVHISAVTTAYTMERIRVGIRDNLAQTAFFANSMVDAADANEPFLWQRVMSHSSTTPTVDVTRHPYWSLVDIRVSRRLEQGTALYYSIQTVTNGDVRVIPYLRTFARSVG